MNTVSFHDAPQQQNFGDLVPNGALAFAVLKLRPANLDQGLIEVQSKTSEARYLDIELTIKGGPWDRRKIFTKIGTHGKEGYINMGRSAVRAILEVGRGAGPQNMAAYGLAAGQYGVDWMPLDGLTVAIKVKIEKGKDNFPDKNEVATWLSPLNPDTAKDFKRLCDGDVQPQARGPAAAGAGAAAAVPWQQPTTGTQQPQQQAAPAAASAPSGSPYPQRQPAQQPAQQGAGGKPPWLA